jgi:hypothetical protein
MNVGMMWFNDNPKTPLATKVLEAAEYYRTKYGQSPDLCLVNPAMYEQAGKEPLEGKTGKVVIRSLRSILPGHLWIGVDEKQSGRTSDKSAH